MSGVLLAGLLTAAFLLPFIVFAWRRNAQLKRALEEAQRKEALGHLASGVAHDFNNILGSILGFSVLLEEDLITQPEQRLMAQHIKSAATRGQGIVGELMRYGRHTNQEAPHADVSLDDIVRESIALLKPSLRSSSAVVYNNKAEQDVIPASATQIAQALLNLCLNADQAIGQKTGEIAITLENETVKEQLGHAEDIALVHEEPLTLINGKVKPGRYLRLSVADNGSGMTPDVAKRVFDPFFTTKDEKSGTGLGLAGVTNIIRAHGGAVVMTTTPFKGTTFRLMFPLEPVQLQRAARRAGKASS